MVSKIYVLLIVALVSIAPLAYAVDDPSKIPELVDIRQNLGRQLDLELEFYLATGQAVKLSDILNKEFPTIITPVYYQCPRQCTVTLNGVVKLINDLPLKLGADYQVISYTINPKENSELALAKSQTYHQALDEPDLAVDNWLFLTAGQESITKLSQQLGFEYYQDKTGEFIHSTAIMLITPSGQISRYFFGATFEPSDVRLSLVEASEGKIGSLVDKLLLFCFAFDPSKGKYSLLIWDLSRIVLIGFCLGLFALLIVLRLRERRSE